MVAALVCLGGFLAVPLVVARDSWEWAAGVWLLGCAAAATVVAALGMGPSVLVLLAFLPFAGFVLLDSRAAWTLAGCIAVLLTLVQLLPLRSAATAAPSLAEPGVPSPGWALVVALAVTSFAIAWISDLYERRMAGLSHELHIHATRDHLTGLVNRRHFDDLLENECRRAARSHHSLALVLIDIDHFKNLNDTFGHPHGDLCLIAVGYALTTCMRRAGDVAARYGGEEFVALFPEATEDQAIQIAESIRAAVQRMRIPNGESPSGVLTLSLGVAAGVEPDELQPDRLLEAVDAALYRAKEGGRDRVVGASARA
jgi:diguanylate cyclase (GGDEF)-like protein